MLDLAQTRLTRTEWTSIEIPLPPDEREVNKLICDGYADPDICRNSTLSLLAHLRIAPAPAIHSHLFKRYIEGRLADITHKYDFAVSKPKTKAGKLRKPDELRLANADKKMGKSAPRLFEFVLLEALASLHSAKRFGDLAWLTHFYTLRTLSGYKVAHLNVQLREILADHLQELEAAVSVADLVERAGAAIERNHTLLQYADKRLFDHQRKLFTLAKRPGPKLVSYVAPTGTGKTLSPLGLACGHRVIFMCAARHVGLALAKAAISSDRKVAFAFGCEDAEDIRLHYFAAKEYIKHRKSGGIAKVDNSVGDEVEIMICDLQSYEVAMHYMLAFNAAQDMFLYWDEPTITLDYSDHPLHRIIQENWQLNVIPNVVLSSATLPHEDDLQEMFGDFRARFEDADVHTIVSHDVRKTIPLLGPDGRVLAPHTMGVDFETAKEMARHCLRHYTLLRYIDLEECLAFMRAAHEHGDDEHYYALEDHIPSVSSVTMPAIKTYYLRLILAMDSLSWCNVCAAAQASSKTRRCGARLSTCDAHTLTDGPTIYLADDVSKVAQFQLQDARIPSETAKRLMKVIKYNSNLSDKYAALQMTLEDGLQKEEGKDKKVADGRLPPELKRVKVQMEEIQSRIRAVSIGQRYVPNTLEHLSRFVEVRPDERRRAFCSDVSEEVVERIMLIEDVDDSWKLLLLMGIGVFAAHKSAKYTEVMKTLAQEQKLYLIIASTDYIYGTNYQFCHGYLGKDLTDISQEKCIQAMGRVGRKSLQMDYSLRLRDARVAVRLFSPSADKPEVKNMQRLFTTPIN